ncbi:hypothetical protein BU14_0245s0005, partial [Porphyra umbilicalis]
MGLHTLRLSPPSSECLPTEQMAVASNKNPAKPEVDHKEQEHHQEGLDHRPPSLDPPPRRTQPTSDPPPLGEPSLP